jgi:hypothetical protein
MVSGRPTERCRGLPCGWRRVVGYLVRGSTSKPQCTYQQVTQPEGNVAFESGALSVVQAGPELMLALQVSAFCKGDIVDIRWLADRLQLCDAAHIIELTEQIMKEPLAKARRDDLQELFKRGAPQLEVDVPNGPDLGW